MGRSRATHPAWPLPAVENNDSEFFRFDYTGTITGDIRLNEIRRGQPDGTLGITIVPEPGAALLAAAGGLLLMTMRRR